MKITLVAVSSINGKITKGSDKHVYTWTSKDDAMFFRGLIAKHNLIIMGRKTYEASRKNIKLEKGRLRVIWTRDAQQYQKQAIDNILEFSNDAPEKLTKELSKRGYNEMLLAGGGQINMAFLKAGLVNEIYLTIEPKIFGTGTDIFKGEKINAELKLLSIKQLNVQGTLLLHYQVIN